MGGWRASLVLQCKACLLVVRADWLAPRSGGVFWLVGDVQRQSEGFAVRSPPGQSPHLKIKTDLCTDSLNLWFFLHAG